MTTLFISDLHLEADRPDIADQFLRFLETEALAAEALYILGDLFESWVGDDDPNEHYQWIKQALRKLTHKRVPVYFMHGNRDFMIGDGFAKETGASILPDPHVAELYGESVLLSHGDAYCTDDLEYQAVRKMTRDPQWQAMMLQKSLPEPAVHDLLVDGNPAQRIVLGDWYEQGSVVRWNEDGPVLASMDR